jgi:hypothetical protein
MLNKSSKSESYLGMVFEWESFLDNKEVSRVRLYWPQGLFKKRNNPS